MAQHPDATERPVDAALVANGVRSSVPPSSLTHAVNERERCPQTEVKGSNPFGRANDISTIGVLWSHRLQQLSAECPRNPFCSRSCRRVAHVH